MWMPLRRRKISTFCSFYQAKWVATWIEKDSKIAPRLELGFRCSERERVRFSFVEIVNEKVEMQTLGLWSLGPRHGCDVRDFLKADGWMTVVEQFDPRHFFWRKIAERFDLETA